MRNIKIIFICLITTILVSCEKKDDKVTCSDMDINFVYSIGFPTDSSYATVCYSNVSSDIPKNSQFEWQVNGDDGYNYASECPIFRNNGHFSISLTVTTPEGLICSTYKEFDITEIR